MKPPRRNALRTVAATVLSTLAFGAAAQDAYPSRPIRIVVPYPAGGTTDQLARAIQKPMQDFLKQPVIVENKAGAGGTIGTDQVVKSAPDGYTIVFGNSGPNAIVPLMRKIPYDPLKDLRPISTVAIIPHILAVPADTPAKTLKEFVALAKQQDWNFGSVGNGSQSHLAGEHFNAMAGLKLTHIPYAGGPPMMTALGGGQLQAAFVTGLDGAGMLQALGVRLLNARGDELEPGGAALIGLDRIDLRYLDKRLQQVQVQVAVDVNNPLCGPGGASAVFGPQKGASADQVRLLDAALAHFADCAAQTLGQDSRDQPGAGAAGGLGFALKAFLAAAFCPGVELVARVTGLADALQGADLLITGEGRLDSQSLHGKTPIGVARIARQAGVPVVALAGSLGLDYQTLYAVGIDAAFSLAPGPVTLSQALSHTAAELEARTCDLARLWSVARCAPGSRQTHSSPV